MTGHYFWLGGCGLGICVFLGLGMGGEGRGCFILFLQCFFDFWGGCWLFAVFFLEIKHLFMFLDICRISRAIALNV